MSFFKKTLSLKLVNFRTGPYLKLFMQTNRYSNPNFCSCGNLYTHDVACINKYAPIRKLSIQITAELYIRVEKPFDPILVVKIS